MVFGCKFGASNTPTESATTSNSNSAPAAGAEVESKNIAEPKTSPSPAQAANAVCTDPAKPCNHPEKQFEDWEISFKMPKKLKGNTPYSSAPFYAVILEVYDSSEDCDGGAFREADEAKRKQLQREFPKQKVFTSYGCPDLAAVQYEFDGNYDATGDYVLIGAFLAIYAGPTKEDADKLLQHVKADYPKAMVKKMTASYQVIVQ